MKRLSGITAALLTPFDKNGKIDTGFIADHCDFLIESGVDCLYVMGTTGEVFLLTPDERKRTAEFVVNHIAGRAPVFVQVGAMPTEAACDLAKHAEAIGADGIGAVTPYFFSVSQESLRNYYTAIAASVDDSFPVYLYNVPGCTTNDLLPETVRQLAKIRNVVGVKNSMPDLERVKDLISVAPPSFDIIQGNDAQLYPALMLGVRGSISGNANVFPEVMVGLYRAVRERDFDKAGQYDRLIQLIVRTLKNGSNLAYFKQALAFRGFRKTFTRAPLPDVSDDEKCELEHQMKTLVDMADALTQAAAAD